MESSSPPPASGLSAILALRRHPVVRRVAEAASAHGTPAHLVGGMVRDAWLGRATRDVDAVVGGRGEEIARWLAETLPARFVPLGGKEFAAFRLVGDGFELDLWDREGMTVTEDLARRDFTVNTLALDLQSDAPARGSGRGPREDGAPVVDPFGGLGDLERRLLRATTSESFTGDPLRVLRLPRFLAQLPGFRVDEPTRELARRAAPGLPGVAAERIREELLRLFAAEGAAGGLREMAVLGLYPGLFLDRFFRRRGDPGSRGGSPDPGAELAAREMEGLPAAVARLKSLADEIGPAEIPPVDSALASALDLASARWASAFFHLPRTEGTAGAGRPRGVTAVERLRDLGYLSRRTAEPVLVLVRDPRPPPGGHGSAGEVARRRALHRLGPLWTTALAWWGARAGDGEGAGDGESGRKSWETTARELLELIRDDGPWILDPPRLVTGDDVRELLGLPPGPELGEALDRVREAQVDGRVRTREEAVAWLTGRSRRRTSSRPP